MKKSISILFASNLVASLLACSPGITTQEAQFTLQPAQTSLEVTPGGEVSSFVLLERKAGFTDTVQMRLDAADLPAGLTQEWTRDSVNGDCTLRLLASESTPPGTYKIDLTGTPVQEAAFTGTPIEPSSLKQTGLRATDVPTIQGNLNVTVGPKLADFNISAQPAVVSTLRGGGATFLTEIALRLTGQNGFVGSVDLSVADTQNTLPVGVTASFTRPSVFPGGIFDHSVLRLLVIGSAEPGVYPLTVTAKSALKTKSVAVRLEIKEGELKKGFTRLISDSISRTRPSSATAPSPNQGTQLIAELFNNTSGTMMVVENLPTGVSIVEVNTPFQALPFPKPDDATWRYFKLNVAANGPIGNFPITFKRIPPTGAQASEGVQVKILSLEIKAAQ
jgi:hypothetical protein